MFVYAVKLQ